MENIKPPKLQPNDVIGVIAPSRPIYNIEKEVSAGADILEKNGYKIKFGKNIRNQFYYSAGSIKERADDLNTMFADPEVKMIICATGGITSNQILPYIDFEQIKKTPKIFVGFSDITTLLLAIYQKTGLITLHGPDLCSISYINKLSLDHLLSLVSGKEEFLVTPKDENMVIIKQGSVSGRLIGGNILLSNALLGTPYLPDFDNSIWFWEAVNECPAKLDFYLNQFKLSGKLKNIKAMIIGHLDECIDKKYPQDNRKISEIVLEVCKDYDFPIIQTETYGHEIASFYTYPIGVSAQLKTQSKELIFNESPVI